MDIIERDFYMDGAVALARRLLGFTLVTDMPGGVSGGRIVETEAYTGRSDAACHAYGRSAPTGKHRTDVMFGPGGFAYVYLIYGMYDCFNVVANSPGEPEAVLIRALEPVEGLGVMLARRNTLDARKLCSGPGKLCMAMGITRELNGADLCLGDRIYIQRGHGVEDEEISVTPRINVDYAGDSSAYPYRFVIRDSDFLSTRRFLPRRRSGSRE
jgi:DNA-3-methyladenine glycosylase